MSDFALSTPGYDAGTLAQLRARALANQAKANGAAQEKVAKAASEFEAVFISQMLNHMWEGVEVDPMFGGGHGEEMFRGLMIEEQGKAMAKAGGFGLAADIQRKMLEIQEMSSRGPLTGE